MGNSPDTGFSVPPENYLKEIRMQKNRYLRNIATARKIRSSAFGSMVKKETEEIITNLNDDTVKKYIMKYPDFLDTHISNHIAQDRISAWLKESKERSGNSKRDESDPEFAAELMERSFRHRQVMIITRENLFYPAQYKQDELNELIESPSSDEYEDGIQSHFFPYTQIPTESINKVFISMVNKLLGKNAFPMPQLCYFLSALKANYYNIEYHNYNHALSHAQSMYWILKRNPEIFNELEMKSLLISAIAHDVAHPGVTDSYLKATGYGLEKLYMSPILENHHTQTCFLILQDINCNVFTDLEGDDYKQVLAEIKHNILSTSLLRYKVQCQRMNQMIETHLNFDNKEVRDAIKSVLMMTCDLCACWKVWQEHKNSVASLYEEFFRQGEKEMNFGIKTRKEMLKQNSDHIPEYQVNFLENLALPVFEIAVKVFPNISAILDSTRKNLEQWNTYKA